jgi:hypothetical protein
MTEVLQQFEAYKFIKFEPEDEVFEFLRLAGIPKNDVFKWWEAIGFYYGYKLKGE